ncbi:MAG TPA: trehalose-6-phosphate synthase [Terriglobales bacterium]|nr:trehalose-6-phosphate synthase [Terriglobales bacterium]
MTAEKGRLIIVSNRLPISVLRQGDGTRVEPSPGGLATALSAVWSTRSNGLWIGWPGNADGANIDPLLAQAARNEPYDLQAVSLNDQEIAKFYIGFANEIIWPLFHDLQSQCNFNPEYWEMYQQVNRKFADTTAPQAGADDFVWVHDYHFMLVAQYLRDANVKSKIGFFQHIPFPPPDIFEKLPWREAILRGLLQYDVLGFQTERDHNNFLNCLARLLPAAETVGGSQAHISIRFEGRETVVGAFPISIDFDEFAGPAAQADVSARAANIRKELSDSLLMLGVDRMDYTKGIPERLQSFRVFLERYPELRRQVTLVQIVVPSRSDIPKYQDLRQQVELLVSEINGQYTESGWVPIHYMYRSLRREDLLGYYRAADIALITPLKDGMNLVAKEFCAAQVDERGVLVLSEFAGASPELRHGALLVNPNDFVGVAQAIYEACQMLPAEKRRRMKLLREIVKSQDVHRWARSFMSASASASRPRSVPPSGGGNLAREAKVGGVPGVAVLGRTLPSRRIASSSYTSFGAD